MQPELRIAIDKILLGESLDQQTIHDAVGAIMDGRCDEVETASLLTALAIKGETEAELAGAALAMRERCTKISTQRTGLMDTCGTGGDRLHTFNISTATALVIAATGIPVAKHGNRSVSSTSGSAEVLEALGVNIGLTPDQAGACLDEIGICYCYARTCHSAMRHAAPVRQKLGFRTLFNLLGPLTNPAGAEFQLLGAPRDKDAERIAGAARRLGTGRAFVICGNDQLDEVSLWGRTCVWDVSHGQVRAAVWLPEMFGLPECTPEDLRVASATESAQVIHGILAGEQGPARNIVLANAAAAQLCHGSATTLKEGVERAAAVIDNGQVQGVLSALVEWTNRK